MIPGHPPVSAFRSAALLLLACSLAYLATGCGGSSGESEGMSEVRELRSELKELESRVAALEAGGKQEPRPLAERIDELLATLRDGDILERYRAGRDLAELGERATPALRKALRSGDDGLRRAALLVLAKTADQSAVPEIRSVLRQSESDSDKSLALLALGRMGTPEAEEGVLLGLADDSREVQFAAVQAASEMDSERAVGPLVQYLTHKDEVLRGAAKRALLDICDEEFPGLETVWRDSNARTRVRLVDLFSELDTEDAREGLKLALEEENPALQLLAARALAGKGDYSGVPAARAHLNIENPRLNQMAMEVLKEAGYDLHFDENRGEYVLSEPEG